MSEVIEPAPASPTVRPLVGKVISNRAPWLFAIAALAGGTALFAALESHRAVLTEPAIAPPPDAAAGMIAPPPTLAIPPDEAPTYTAGSLAPAAPLAPLISAPLRSARQRPQRFVASNPEQATPPVTLLSPHDTQFSAINPGTSAPATTPQVVFDARSQRPVGGSAVNNGNGAKDGKDDERVLATRFANPATTIPKGTVIQAVLETALDSTRAGLTRAIISRDVYGFDGTRLLVPKGSRLIGEYKSDLAAGQNRALIQWQRLMRPDGAMINLDSPSADPLGRAGIKGKVNSHFLARFGSAILQSSLQVGSQVAINRLSDGTAIYAAPGLYALPGALPGATTAPAPGSSGFTPNNAQPTLTVQQGTSISVFVAKDLDFTSVEP